MLGGHQYDTTTITGNATAVIGDKYGDTINIHHATFLLQATSLSQPDSDFSKTVHHNQILPGGQTTIESIVTYNHGSNFPERGQSHQRQLLWRRCEDIGVGTFGEVHREETIEHGQPRSRAVKVLGKRRLEYMQIDHRKELDALIHLSQPNFVHRFVEFHSWYESSDAIHMAMEYIPFGDLANHIEAGLAETDIRDIAYQVLDGIRVMHRLDLIHRDIKPANIFVVKRQPIWWVKIGDFSICKRSRTEQTVLRTKVGTDGYQAPEVVGLVDTGKVDMYDYKCDIWSFGCLIFKMLTKALPFETLGALNSYCNEEMSFPGDMIKEAGRSFLIAEFTWYMLQADPSARPTADQAVFLLDHRCGPGALTKQVSVSPDFIYLRDPLKRYFCLPLSCCTTWAEMASTLRILLAYISRYKIGQRICQGQYELRDATGVHLNPQNWEQVVVAGTCVFVLMKSDSGRKTPECLRDDGQSIPAARESLQYAPRATEGDSNSNVKSQKAPSHGRDPPPTTESLHSQNIDVATSLRTSLEAAERKQDLDDTSQSADDAVYGYVKSSGQSQIEMDIALSHEAYNPQTHVHSSYASDKSASSTEAELEAALFSPLQGQGQDKIAPNTLAGRDYTDGQGVQDCNLAIVSPDIASNQDGLAVQTDAMSDSVSDIVSRSKGPDSSDCISATCRDFGHSRSDSALMVHDEALVSNGGMSEVHEVEAGLESDPPTAGTGSHNLEPSADHELLEADFDSDYFIQSNAESLTLSEISQNLFDGENPEESRIERVSCPGCLPRLQVGSGICGLCECLQLEKKIFLKVGRHNVFAVPWSKCRSWITTKSFIWKCFSGRYDQPLIERGYFHLLEPDQHEPEETSFDCHIVEISDWQQLHKKFQNVTFAVVVWYQAWIFNLPKWIDICQFTDTGLSPWIFDRVRSHAVVPRHIYFTNRDNEKSIILWRTARRWTRFSRCINHGRPVQERCDIFVLELQNSVAADAWSLVKPGMHVYELIHPNCSFYRRDQVEAVVQELGDDLRLQRTLERLIHEEGHDPREEPGTLDPFHGGGYRLGRRRRSFVRERHPSSPKTPSWRAPSVEDPPAAGGFSRNELGGFYMKGHKGFVIV